MSCVMFESDALQLSPAIDVLVVPYSVRLQSHAIRRVCVFVYVCVCVCACACACA